jgi:hypothetical protein
MEDDFWITIQLREKSCPVPLGSCVFRKCWAKAKSRDGTKQWCQEQRFLLKGDFLKTDEGQQAYWALAKV